MQKNYKDGREKKERKSGHCQVLGKGKFNG